LKTISSLLIGGDVTSRETVPADVTQRSQLTSPQRHQLANGRRTKKSAWISQFLRLVRKIWFPMYFSFYWSADFHRQVTNEDGLLGAGLTYRLDQSGWYA